MSPRNCTRISDTVSKCSLFFKLANANANAHVQVPASHPVVQSLAAFSVEEFAAHSFRTANFKAGSHFDVLEV